MNENTIKTFLVGRAVALGKSSPNIDQLFDAAIDAGFGMFWGWHGWTFRRNEVSISTVASQAYNELPTDFEQMCSMYLEEPSNAGDMHVLPEETFNFLHPYPAGNAASMPKDCKIVQSVGYVSTAASPKPWRVFYSPVPNAVYTIKASYYMKGSRALIASLPSYALPGLLGCTMYFAGFESLNNALVLLQESLNRDSGAIGIDGRIGQDEDERAFDFAGGSGYSARSRSSYGIYID